MESRPFNRNMPWIAAAIVGLFAVLAPVFVALYLAKQSSLNEQMSFVASIARDVLRRGDEAFDQTNGAFATLKAAHAADPCSEDNIHLMEGIELTSNQLQAVGYVANDKVMCSSLGNHGDGIPIGPADYHTPFGNDIRSAVELPIAPGVKFYVSTNLPSGYTAFVHPELPIDVFVDNPVVSLGLVSAVSKRIIFGRGSYKPEWDPQMSTLDHLEYFDGKNLVAIRKSTKFFTAAFAAIPASTVENSIRHTALIVVPIGFVAGIALALAVFSLAKRQLGLPTMLKGALRRGELFMNYQPVIDLQSGRWVGAEALVRWRPPSGDSVSPDVFIPAAEQCGLIQLITERVFELVDRDFAQLFKRHPSFHVAINLSADDLHADRVVELLRALAKGTNAGPENIVVEATETGFIKADLARDTIRKIRALGIRVAIDDFGTGYSSLSSLKMLELDVLKIDKSFVEAVGTDAPTRNVTRHIIEMAKELNLKMVAEGVETEAQANYLRENGVHYAQGWLFARPMAFADLIATLDRSLSQPGGDSGDRPLEMENP